MTVPVLVLMVAAMVTAMSVSLRDHAAHSAAVDLANLRAGVRRRRVRGQLPHPRGMRPARSRGHRGLRRRRRRRGRDRAGLVEPDHLEASHPHHRRAHRGIRPRAGRPGQGPSPSRRRSLLTAPSGPASATSTPEYHDPRPPSRAKSSEHPPRVGAGAILQSKRSATWPPSPRTRIARFQNANGAIPERGWLPVGEPQRPMAATRSAGHRS